MPITLTIDGKSITAQPGQTVLDAAKQKGIHIPTLCADPELEPFGACRLCVVEIEKMRGLPTACTTPVAEGMIVHTSTALVERERRNTVELLLSDHPQDCLTCVKNQRCDLQWVAAYVGVRKLSYQGERRAYAIDESNPFYGRDLEKCILCGKCVRACNELQGRQAIHFGYRGFSTKITTLYDMPMWDSTCESCGRCVDMCPTAALYDKAWLNDGWHTGQTATICPYCGVGCGLILQTRAGKVVGVRGDRKNAVNRGHMCVKGRFGYGFIHHKDRLTRPLVKKDGTFVESTWDEALDLVASKLAEIKRKDGPDSLAVLASAKATNEENYLIQKFTRAVLGTNNVDHCARL